jgi:hypothetical protein
MVDRDFLTWLIPRLEFDRSSDLQELILDSQPRQIFEGESLPSSNDSISDSLHDQGCVRRDEDRSTITQPPMPGSMNQGRHAPKGITAVNSPSGLCSMLQKTDCKLMPA